MIGFGDLQYLRTIDEYLSTLDEARRFPIRQMFAVSRLALELAHQAHGHHDPLPEIKIRSSTIINAEAMPGRIYLTEGLVNTCADLTLPENFHNIMEIDESLSVPLHEFSLAFSLAHEYMHIARKHSDFEQELGGSDRFMLATEYDADLCGTAVVYRLAQHFYGNQANDRDVRSITLFCILWLILSMPHSSLATTHSSTAERIWGIYLKVCSLRQNRYAPADPSCEGPECRQMAEYLPQVMMRISKLRPDLPFNGEGIFGQMLRGLQDSSGEFTAADAWEDIRRPIEGGVVRPTKQD